MSSITDTVAEHRAAYDEGRKQGQHEGIQLVLDEMRKAIDHEVDLVEWYGISRAMYEEFKP